MGKIACKFLVVLNGFLKASTNDQGDITVKNDEYKSKPYITRKTLKTGVTSLIHSLGPSIDTTRLPSLSISLYHILVGDKALKGDYYQAAVVASSMVSGLSGFLHSSEGARNQLSDVTSQDLSGERAIFSESLNALELSLGYQFSRIGFLENALTQFDESITNQGLSCRRMETLGDGVLDVLLAKYLLIQFPSINGKSLSRVHTSLVNKHVFTAAAIYSRIDSHLCMGPQRSAGDQTELVTMRASMEQARGSSLPNEQYWKTPNITLKTLCDSFESVIGAVFIDSNLDFNEVTRVFDRTLRPMLNGRVTL
jgi:dsRNA-specific ribonuclease